MIFEVLSFLINLELRHFMFFDHCHVCITFTTSLGRILFSRGLPIGCWCAICIYTIFFFIVIYLWCVQTFTESAIFSKIQYYFKKFLVMITISTRISLFLSPDTPDFSKILKSKWLQFERKLDEKSPKVPQQETNNFIIIVVVKNQMLRQIYPSNCDRFEKSVSPKL